MALWDWCRPMWILETNMKIRHACKRSSKSREARAEAPKVRSCISKRLEHPITEETLALCLDMYTDDFWKHSYLDIHVNWVDNSSHHMALALWDVGHPAHTACTKSRCVQYSWVQYSSEYCISAENTWVTTDHGSNAVARPKTCIRLDCICHWLHSVLEKAWKHTKRKIMKQLHTNKQSVIYCS